MFLEVVRKENQESFQVRDVAVRVKELIHHRDEVFGQMGDVQQLF